MYVYCTSACELVQISSNNYLCLFLIIIGFHDFEVWNENDSDEDDDLPPDNQPENAASTNDLHRKPLRNWLIVFLLYLKARCYVPYQVIC